MRMVVAAIVIALAFAAPAEADVLVNAPASEVACGHTMRLGVWYRDFPTTGHRDVRVSVRDPNGRIVFHRHVQAPSHWEFWRYKPACGRTYTVRYTTAAGPTTFHVKVPNIR